MKTLIITFDPIKVGGKIMDDHTAAQIVKHSDSVDFKHNLAIVSFHPWVLPFPILEKIWPLI